MEDDRIGPLSIITLDELVQRCPTATAYLALPPGWAIAVHSDTRDELWFDGDLLMS